MTTPTVSKLGQHAVRLAELGFRVLPCWPTDVTGHHHSKSPIGYLVPPRNNADGTITPGGKSKATTNQATIVSWWNREPDAMIGAVVPQGILVLDFDPYHGGTVEALERAAGVRLPPTVTVVSGRGDGSQHRYFRFDYTAFDPTSKALPDGIDLRKAERHYLLMPPSIHPVTGRPYQWDRSVTRAAPLPPAVVEMLRPKLEVPLPRGVSPIITTNRVAAIIRSVENARGGDRNDKLFWAACKLTELGVTDAYGPLGDAARSTGLPDAEIEAVIRKAIRRITPAARTR